jgi:hypothetical protein
MLNRRGFWLWAVTAGLPLAAQSPGNDFFEKKIRPVLATKCYACHASTLPAPMGGLALDTKAGLRKGGVRGVDVVPGNPGESRLLRALRYADPQLQMPPGGKLEDAVIADFEQWIAAGAPDPREEAPAVAAAPLKGMSVAEGRKWWAFQPVREHAAPRVKHILPRTKIDAFLLAKLEAKGLGFSPEADARTLAQRAYVDLLGYKPTYEEVDAFLRDASPDAYEKLLDRLLASPQYGERWGRHWLDVARFAEDNPTSEATNPPYPFAWRYRDWVIEAINKDVPYDRFVKLQLAADLMADATRDDLRALGYLGTAPIYHKDARLSQSVLYGFATDDWDERVDAVTRGLLGLTVACARCHDHKFDPIPTKDYYSLAGVFASTMRAKRPLFEIEPQIETRFAWLEQRLFELSYMADMLTNEPTTVLDSASKVARMRVEVGQLREEVEGLGERYPQLVELVRKYWEKIEPPKPAAGDVDPGNARTAAVVARRRGPNVSAEPFANAVYEAALYVDGADPALTQMDYRPGEPRDLPVFHSGNVETPGETAPRQFLSVLARGANEPFRKGSGRLEFAEKIFTDAAPLAARVIVNRVWGWHFGKPLVATTSDFGTQGEKPAHPELLDDLAARFMAKGWSLKWLHREIMLSAAYRQSSRVRPEAQQADQGNALLWRMNPRRLDVEAYRDSILRAAGNLSETMYGPSQDLDAEGNQRRTIYGHVSRGRLNTVLKLYDYPDPTQTSPGRDLTTTSLQQLFVMNSAFIQEQAAALAASAANEADEAAQIRSLYRKVLARDPRPEEVELASGYLREGTLAGWAQVLLASNEEVFWP